jgi:hypothetical protein
MRREVIFALSKILLQLCFGAPWKSLQRPEDIVSGTEGNQRISDDFTARRLAGKVWEEETERYEGAVRYCVDWKYDIQNRTIDEDSFQRAMCEQVLYPLQEDLQNFRGNLSQVH